MGKDLENIATTYYKLHQQMADSLIVREGDCIAPVKAKKALRSYNDLTEKLRIKLKYSGKVSEVLVEQLFVHHLEIGERYIIANDDKPLTVIEFYKSKGLLDLIGLIELDKCPTEQEPFETELLKGLSYVCHGASTKGYSAVKNCIHYWYYNGKLKKSRETELQELLDESELDVATRMFSKALASLKTNDVTGDWLIYKNHNEINYYLCLVKQDEGDASIYEHKIRRCLDEFPELRDIGF